jgi:hypothetical protein
MGLFFLILTAILVASPVRAQETAPSPSKDPASQAPAAREPLGLPVSLERIKEGLEQTPTLSLRTLDARPTFRVQILERQKLDELLATLNYKAGPTPAGGIYWNELQRQMFPAVDNPLLQPYAAFGENELLTILIENLVGKYLGGKAINAVSRAERERAENAAKDEVKHAIREYCAAQPDNGNAIPICTSLDR